MCLGADPLQPTLPPTPVLVRHAFTSGETTFSNMEIVHNADRCTGAALWGLAVVNQAVYGREVDGKKFYECITDSTVLSAMDHTRAVIELNIYIAIFVKVAKL